MMMPRTAKQLQKLLEERNLYPWYAAANGTEPHEGYGLRKEGPEWVVYLHASMTAPNYQYFDAEEEAVAYLIEQLRQDGFAEYLLDL